MTGKINITGLLHCDVCGEYKNEKHRFIPDIEVTLCMNCAPKWLDYQAKLGLNFLFCSKEHRLKTFQTWRDKQKNAKEKVILT
jgi:hypothetical protein